MKKLIFILVMLINSVAALAQQVSAGAAFMTYKGDLNPSRSNNPFSWKPAYSFALEKRILNEKADISLGIVSGIIMYAEQSININRNFKTNILQPEISFRYILANEKLNARPYLGAGVAYTLYKTYYDLASRPRWSRTSTLRCSVHTTRPSLWIHRSTRGSVTGPGWARDASSRGWSSGWMIFCPRSGSA